MPTYRTATVDAVHNDEELRLNLDLLEEKRERAVICEAKAKRKMIKYYNARVRGVTFRPGDFVYRSNDASHDVAGGKLRPKWEGPYEVTDALGDGAYKLRSMDGAVLPRTWNIANLKKSGRDLDLTSLGALRLLVAQSMKRHPSVRFEDPEEQSVRTRESRPTSADGRNQLHEFCTQPALSLLSRSILTYCGYGIL
ncbi:hypothetical protein Tco_0792536 [Tanacetum coccineum]